MNLCFNVIIPVHKLSVFIRDAGCPATATTAQRLFLFSFAMKFNFKFRNPRTTIYLCFNYRRYIIQTKENENDTRN